QPDDLLAVELVRVEPVAPVVLDNLVLNAREKRRQAVVIVLRPAVERVIVTAGALQAEAEKHLTDRLRPGLRVAEGAVEVRGGLAVGATAGGQDFAGELVERLVVGDALPQPLVKYLHALAVEHLLLVAEHVRPLLGPEIRKFGPLQ